MEKEMEYMSPEESEFYPSIFDYSSESATLEIYRFLWNRYRKLGGERLGDLEGKRVCWSDNKEKEGTLMKFKEGKILILWDEHKGSKLPYFDYPASNLG
jgi:monoamine oxidase